MIGLLRCAQSFSVTFKKSKVFVRSVKSIDTTKRRSKLIFQDEVSTDNKPKEMESDDIHSARLTEALRVQSRDLDEQEERVFKFDFFRRSDFKQLDLSNVNAINLLNDQEMHNCATLKHNLNYILEHPGIYPFEEVAKLLNTQEEIDYLRNVYPQEKLAMERFSSYKPPSFDTDLHKLAKNENMKFMFYYYNNNNRMSSSTISNFLCQIYYALSGFKNPYFEQVFMQHEDEPKKFMVSQRKPISNYIHRMKTDDGYTFYSMDNDKGLFEMSHILMNVGNIVERQLTIEKKEFETLFKADVPTPTHLLPLVDHHRHVKLNNEILLRSQIDCHSFRKDGTPYVFEIKSRAACPIRYDFPNCMDYTDYEITQQRGLHSSYEREYYDLIRGAFLKWAFQLRIGRMEGAFVAYHNIRNIQGFEYLTAQEIDRRVFGTSHYAETIFIIGSRLLTTIINELFDVHLKDEDWESLKVGAYASSHNRKLILFVELFKERKDIDKYVVVEQSEGIQNEYDYFQKVNPLVNKIDVNGVRQNEASIAFRQGDVLNVLYQMRSLGNAQFADYMNFLHDCYKFDEINLDVNYTGAWVKSQYG